MFSGVVASMALCRGARGRVSVDASPPPPVRFVRAGRKQVAPSGPVEPEMVCGGVVQAVRARDQTETQIETQIETQTQAAGAHMENEMRWLCDYYRAQRLRERVHRRFNSFDGTHRDEALLPGDGENGVVAARAARGRVDEDVDHVVGDPGRWGLGKHDVHINRLEDLLQGVEGEPTQFAFDEIWPVLHNGLEFEVPITALPARDEVEHVGAVRRLPVFSALGAGEGDAEGGEHGEVGGLVAHAEEAREEVDLARDGGDGQEARGADDEEREYCFVGEGGVDVRGLPASGAAGEREGRGQ